MIKNTISTANSINASIINHSIERSSKKSIFLSGEKKDIKDESKNEKNNILHFSTNKCRRLSSNLEISLFTLFLNPFKIPPP